MSNKRRTDNPIYKIKLTMNDDTHAKLIRDGRNFIQQKFKENSPADDELIGFVLQKAYHCQPTSWANLKRSVAIYLDHVTCQKLAETIRALKNPAITNKEYPTIPKKVKKLSIKDADIIFGALNKHKSEALKSAVFVAFHLGARPSEFKFIKPTSASTFKITTSKKSEDGKRGVDREVIVNDPHIAEGIRISISKLKDIKVKKLQDNFSYLMKGLFPRRKKRPTLYTFKHQLASTFKANGFSNEVIAYLLGHKSTRTQEHYGHSKSGGGRDICIEPSISESEIKSFILDRHSKRDAKLFEKIIKEKLGPSRHPKTAQIQQ